ncbi:hypothetical protein KKB55_23375, partial [Myxococcota bacterium]|nr:hypothetical protein [Myxococcota bacterium]
MVKSDKKLREVIEKMEAERILDLAKILKLYDPDGDKNFAKKTRDEQVSALCNEISSVGGHSVANFFRGKGVSYREVITDVAVHLKVELKPAMTVAEMEGAIAQKALQQLLEKLTPEQREELAESIEQEAAKYGKSFKKEGGVLTALALGQMSGFTIYLAASTVVGALTGFLGITLSFGFYAGMSSAI